VFLISSSPYCPSIRRGDELLTMTLTHAGIGREFQYVSRKEVSMNSDALLNIEELEIEPITDEILVSVLGGLGEEDGFWPSCSYTMCSSKPIDE
jgi:hypothetical protein